MSEAYDVIIIGGGSAGSTAAKIAARDKRRVALIERDKLGGTCLNYGCDPTKTLLDSAHAYAQATRADELGFHVDGASLDWSRALARVHRIINTIRNGDEDDAIAHQRARGIDVFIGEGTFVDAHHVRVNDQLLRGERMVLATGSRPMIPPIDGLDTIDYLTNENLLDPERSLPARLAIIGGGPVSIEFTQILTRFGVDVTTIEMLPRILSGDDEELAALLRDRLEAEGATFVCGATARAVRRGPGDVLKVSIEREDGDAQELEVDQLLVATGRRPNSESLNCEAAGIALDEHGYVPVDDCLRTSQPHIFAAGDLCSPEMPYTHVASPQAKLALRNAFSDTPQPFNRQAIPHATYTDPALAAVGKTEAQLQQEGVDYCVGSGDLQDIPRGLTSGQTLGRVKILATNDGQLLGGHILGPHAGDLIAPIVLAMRNGLGVEAIDDAIFPYPTFVQAVHSACTQVCPS